MAGSTMVTLANQYASRTDAFPLQFTANEVFEFKERVLVVEGTYVFSLHVTAEPGYFGSVYTVKYGEELRCEVAPDPNTPSPAPAPAPSPSPAPSPTPVVPSATLQEIYDSVI